MLNIVVADTTKKLSRSLDNSGLIIARLPCVEGVPKDVMFYT